MQSIKQFHNDQQKIFASVVSEPRQSLLMDIWNGEDQEFDDLVKVMDYSLKSIKENGLQSWLGEVRKLESLFELDQRGASHYLNAQLSDSDLSKYAFVSVNKETQNQSAMIDVLEENGVEVKTFSTKVMAMQWLLLPAESQKVCTLRPVLES